MVSRGALNPSCAVASGPALCSKEPVVNSIVPQTDGTPVISTSGLTKVFGNVAAVNDLHLEVMKGDVFGFLGPNGSGKTTTIRMLLGLIRPTAGRAILFGLDNASDLPAILQRIGAIVETPVFYPYLSGRDNLRVVAAATGMVSGRSTDGRIAEVLELVGLRTYEKLAYRKYSLGMKQRLGIAAALLSDPELVMLDEPTNGLDPAGVIEIRRLILRLADLGKTIFLSSHVLYEVQQVCNKVAILQKGNLVKQGNVSELLRHDEQIEVRLDKDEETRSALSLLQQAREGGADWLRGAQLQRGRQGQLKILITAPVSHAAEINRLLAQHQLFASAIHPREGSLEEVFLEVAAAPREAPPAIDGKPPAAGQTGQAGAGFSSRGTK
jgi:ABC-2 type transport system ATP-binding protein